jgi:hypothetical protein
MIYQRIHDLLLSEGVKRYHRLYKASLKKPEDDPLYAASQRAGAKYASSVDRRMKKRGQTGSEYTRAAIEAERAGRAKNRAKKIAQIIIGGKVKEKSQ